MGMRGEAVIRPRGGEGRGAVEKERKVENALFLCVVGAHARAIVCLRVISLPIFFYLIETRHLSECTCVCCTGVSRCTACLQSVLIVSCFCVYVCTCV